MALIAMEKQRSVKIYKLIDPITDNVRYVGKTVSKLNDRIKVHIYQSRISSSHTHKEAWIKGLLNSGLKPRIELIEEASVDNWAEREKYWICFYNNLTNLSIGGESGNIGCKHSADRINELRENVKNIAGFYKSGLGRKWTEEQKEIRRKTHAWNKGIKGVVKMSDETKKKMSISRIGKKKSQYKWSIEAKERFKEAHKRSVETRKLNKLK
jgi:hypothetical protein